MITSRPVLSSVRATFLFFASAVIFLVSGMVFLGLSYRENGSFDFIQPSMLLSVHSLFLGGLTGLYFGAAHQLYPVISEFRMKSSGWVALLHSILHPLGVAVLLAGFGMGQFHAVMLGGIIVLAGLILFVSLAFWSLESRRSWTPESVGFYLGLGWLLVVTFLGLVMAGYRSGWWSLPVPVENLRGFHLRAAMGGFFLNLFFGLSHRLVPMFLVSRRTGKVWIGTALTMVNLALLGGGVFLFTGFSHGILLADTVLVMSIPVFAYGVVMQITSRLRPLGGSFFNYSFGVIGLVACAFLWAGGRYGWGPPFLSGSSEWMAVAALLPLGLLPVTFGVSARIIPFLVWQVSCAPLIGKGKLPLVQELWSERLIWGEAILIPLVSGAWMIVLFQGRFWSAAFAATGLLILVRLYNCWLLWRTASTLKLSPV